jgi:hypothetical protein
MRDLLDASRIGLAVGAPRSVECTAEDVLGVGRQMLAHGARQVVVGYVGHGWFLHAWSGSSQRTASHPGLISVKAGLARQRDAGQGAATEGRQQCAQDWQ